MFGHKQIPSREGGVELVTEKLSTGMAAMGHDVTCYNRGGRQRDAEHRSTYRGVRIRTVPTVNIRGLAAVTSSFFSAVAAAVSGARVVHIHAEGPAWMCWIPKLTGKRVVVTVHGLDWQREKWRGGPGAAYIRMGERMAVRWADEIIVLSRNLEQYFLRTYGRTTRYIPNGVDRPRILPACRIREDYGLEKDGYILFLARLVPEKGAHYLMEAYRSLKTEKRLVIAGGDSDCGDYVNRLKTLAGDNPGILFTGFVQGEILEELYSNAWVYVLPSDLEGMPLSLLEAMSYGNCCVISDIPECLEPAAGRAVAFARGDERSLAECLQSLLEDGQTVDRMKAGAREHICGAYTWEAAVAQTLECYRALGEEA